MKKVKRGKALKDYMRQSGIETQSELAQLLEISEGFISLYFKGVRFFGAKKAIWISGKTGIPMEKLYQ